MSTQHPRFIEICYVATDIDSILKGNYDLVTRFVESVLVMRDQYRGKNDKGDYTFFHGKYAFDTEVQALKYIIGELEHIAHQKKRGLDNCLSKVEQIKGHAKIIEGRNNV